MEKMEIRRQLVHLSGLLFVLLAQFIDKFAISIYSFLVAGTFLIYSEYLRREERRIELINRLELKFRGFITKFERKTKRQFMGVAWFYVGFGLTFLLFPLPIASAACAMLAVGDALATLIGIKYGRHKIFKTKSLEGSFTFFCSSLLIALFWVNPLLALFGSLTAMMAELTPKLNDNLTIPLCSGFAMLSLQQALVFL